MDHPKAKSHETVPASAPSDALVGAAVNIVAMFLNGSCQNAKTDQPYWDSLEKAAADYLIRQFDEAD